ncbi:MAG: DUF3303 domain-containing protein [Acidobacteriota bacterium]|nr:DUF3303 domain-containing protein [Acidobacteriota bacterium]
MKFMTSWTINTGNIPEAVARFLSGEAPPPPGVTLLGRWHNTDFSGGYSLIECDDAVAAYTDAAQWADIVDLSTVPVIEDGEAGPVLAKRFKK